ncbi:MAG TPA: HAMP domain-containing sensor histidine kinase, partial [Thermosynechococcaceae cyanobacterium]
QVITELQTEEEQILQDQFAQSQANSQVRMAIENLGTILAFTGLLGVYGLLYRQMFKRQQLEQAQQKLAQEKELGELKLQFFSMVSHEFRTPLSVIAGSSQLLKERLISLVEPDKLKNLLQIQASAKLMTQLLNDILTLARADAGKLECMPELLEMQFFCLNLIEDIQLFTEQPRTIKFAKYGTHTYAYLDEKLLYSILSNLLSNAIKYSSPQSTVYFTLTCEPDVVSFQVKDEGIGIPEGEQGKIFEPFCRGRNAGNVTGSGLGMAVVKKCLDLHQGELSVESQLGIGTTFTIKIRQPQKTGLFRHSLS